MVLEEVLMVFSFVLFCSPVALIISPAASGYCQEGLAGNELFKSSQLASNETKWMGSMWVGNRRECLHKGTSLKDTWPENNELGFAFKCNPQISPLRHISENEQKIKSLLLWPIKDNQLFSWGNCSSAQFHGQDKQRSFEQCCYQLCYCCNELPYSLFGSPRGPHVIGSHLLSDALPITQ